MKRACGVSAAYVFADVDAPENLDALAGVLKRAGCNIRPATSGSTTMH